MTTKQCTCPHVGTHQSNAERLYILRDVVKQEANTLIDKRSNGFFFKIRLAFAGSERKEKLMKLRNEEADRLKGDADQFIDHGHADSFFALEKGPKGIAKSVLWEIKNLDGFEPLFPGID